MPRIEPALVPVVGDLARGLRELGVPFAVGGALVPELLLDARPERITNDADVAVVMASLDDFESLKDRLAEYGFARTRLPHRMQHRSGGLVDLLPFSESIAPRGGSSYRKASSSTWPASATSFQTPWPRPGRRRGYARASVVVAQVMMRRAHRGAKPVRRLPKTSRGKRTRIRHALRSPASSCVLWTPYLPPTARDPENGSDGASAGDQLVDVEVRCQRPGARRHLQLYCARPGSSSNPGVCLVHGTNAAGRPAHHVPGADNGLDTIAGASDPLV
jgi:hypothetical protein